MIRPSTSSRRTTLRVCLALTALLWSPRVGLAQPRVAPANRPVRLAIAGLVHGHVQRFIRLAASRPEVQLVGLSDPDAELRAQTADKTGVSRSLLFADLDTMLDKAQPDAVATFTSTYDHPAVVEACAKRGIHVMMEKPLAVSVEHGQAIRDAAARSGIHVIVNYETTWYASHAALWQTLKVQHKAGDIRKIVAMDGHQGPQEIGVGPEFFKWLTDPVLDGGGALFDFGCYGANLMTWLMDNARPLAVSAITQTNKPSIYPRVDDEATILVQYPKAQGIAQASWNWPFGRKDLEVYAERGYAIATGGNSLKVRLGDAEAARTLDPLPAADRDEVAYLVSIVRGERTPGGLSSLENNLIVTEILAAARESARTGRTINLPSR
jgi:scyllo-inositol 2-dehydrogenase (NADP+)